MKVTRKPALLVAAALVALVAIGVAQTVASIPPPGVRAQADGSPAVTLLAAPDALDYPGVVTLTAYTSNITSTTAKFQVRGADSSIWTDAGSVDSTTGQFSLNYVPKKNSFFRVAVGSAESTPEVYVPLHATMGKPAASSTNVRLGDKLQLSGTIRPYHPVGSGTSSDIRYRLYFEKFNSLLRTWEPYETKVMDISSVADNDMTKWATEYTPKKGGWWRVRFSHNCPRHALAFSPWLEFEVAR